MNNKFPFFSDSKLTRKYSSYNNIERIVKRKRSQKYCFYNLTKNAEITLITE